MPRETFPVDALPAPIGRFVFETSDAMGLDPAFIALPALAALGGAVGVTRSVELKGGGFAWREYPIIWAAVVAPPSCGKSPAFDAALRPMHVAQADAMHDYARDAGEYEIAKLHFERELAAWKKSKQGGDPPQAPDVPVATRYVVSDITIEALAPILEHNRRGLIVARDELAGWIRSFNVYKAGGKGGDAGGWKELQRGGPLIVDRRTGDRRTIFVPRAAACVCGTIQPGVLARVLNADGGEHLESGLAARLLLARPPIQPKRWTERRASGEAVSEYEAIVRALLRLDFNPPDADCSEPTPTTLYLNEPARRLFIDFYNEHARETADAGDEATMAAFGKIEAYCARFALIFALVTDLDAVEVDEASMAGGIALARWFASEAKRVYAELADSPAERQARSVRDWVRARGGSCTARELSRCLRLFRDRPDAAEQALDALAAIGWGRWEVAANPAGGPAAKRFFLTSDIENEGGAGDETPEFLEDFGGFVASDSAHHRKTHAGGNGDGLSDSTPTEGGGGGGDEDCRPPPEPDFNLDEHTWEWAAY